MDRLMTGLILVCLVIASLYAGCSRRDRNPVGSDLPDDDWFGEGPFLDTIPVSEHLTVRLFESAGASPFLLVGSREGLVARSLVRFLVIPEADTILSSKLELTVDELIDTEQLTLTVYPVTEADWEESETTWELMSGTPDEDPVAWNTPGGDFDFSDPLGSVTVTGSDVDSTILIDLDVERIRAWEDTTIDNTGLILIAEDEAGVSGVAEFRSRQFFGEDSNPGPHLLLEYTRPDNPDSVVEGRVLVGEDATLYDFPEDPPDDVLRVGSVPQFRTLLKFDLESFGREIMIRKAVIQLPVRDIVPDERALVLSVLRVTGDWEGADTPLEFTTIDSVEVSADGVPRLGITNLAWSWVGEIIENQGVAVKASVERGRYGYVDFESGSTDAESGPVLVVEYSIPPSSLEGESRRRAGCD